MWMSIGLAQVELTWRKAYLNHSWSYGYGAWQSGWHADRSVVDRRAGSQEVKTRSMNQLNASDPFTEVVTQPLDVDGSPAGLALSLGHNIVFFTTEPDLAALDGVSFSSLAQLTARVRHVRARRA